MGSLVEITADGTFPNPLKFYNDAIVYGTESGSYPSGTTITIKDEYEKENILTSSSDGASGNFGYSVAAYRNYVVVGATSNTAAYIFETTDNGSTWSDTKITPSGGNTANFGRSCAIDFSGTNGDIIAVSSRPTTSAGIGSTYVFKKNAGTWSQTDTFNGVSLGTASFNPHYGESTTIYEN